MLKGVEKKVRREMPEEAGSLCWSLWATIGVSLGPETEPVVEQRWQEGKGQQEPPILGVSLP